MFAYRDNHRLYDHSLTEIESPTGLLQRAADSRISNQLGFVPAVGDAMSLAELMREIKPEDLVTAKKLK